MRVGVMALVLLFGTASAGAGSPAPGAIVFSADQSSAVTGEIYRVDLDGTRVDLSKSPYQDVEPFVSPDGTLVAFLSDRTGQQAVYQVGIDGTGLVRISPPLPQALTPTPIGWVPHSRRFLVVAWSQSAGPGSPNRVVTSLETFADGAAPIVLAHSFDLNGIQNSTPSPDGKLVAYRGDSIVRAVSTTTGKTVFTITGTWGDNERVRLAWSSRNRLAHLAGGSVRILDARGQVLARFPAAAFAWSPTGDRFASMHGGVLEVRSGEGAGRLVLRKRLFSASTIGAIVKSNGAYEPQLTWIGESRVVVANGRATLGVTVPSGATSAVSRTAWAALTCGCTSASGLTAGTVADGSQFALQVSRPDGSGARTLAPVPGCWADGGYGAAVGPLQFAGNASIVYQSTCYEPAANLYTVAADGSGLHRLTQTRLQQTDPAWSPDRTRIAFAQAAATGMSCKGCPAALWVANADGTGAHALTFPSFSDSSWDTKPSWSPDGTHIAYSHSTINSFGELFTIAVAGGNPIDLHVAGASPAWGPTRIAYLGNTNVGGARITLRTVTPDGGDPQTLATGALSSPAWSSDGRLAVLASGPPLHVIEISAAGGTTIVDLPFARATSISWSPDGTRLLIVARPLPAGPYDLYSILPDGTGVRRITTNIDALGASWR